MRVATEGLLISHNYIISLAHFLPRGRAGGPHSELELVVISSQHFLVLSGPASRQSGAFTCSVVPARPRWYK